MAILKRLCYCGEKKTWTSHVRQINNSGKCINWRDKIGQYSERSIWVLLTDTDHDKTFKRSYYIKRRGFFLRAWLFFSVHISVESCTLNLLYGISKLPCKIDQRELEHQIFSRSWDVSCYSKPEMSTTWTN